MCKYLQEVSQDDAAWRFSYHKLWHIPIREVLPTLQPNANAENMPSTWHDLFKFRFNFEKFLWKNESIVERDARNDDDDVELTRSYGSEDLSFDNENDNSFGNLK